MGRRQIQRPEFHDRQIAVAKQAPELSGRARGALVEGEDRAAAVWKLYNSTCMVDQSEMWRAAASQRKASS